MSTRVALNLDHEVAVTVNGQQTTCSIGINGVSYISGEMCEQLGIPRSTLKSATEFTTLYASEKLRNMSIVPELTVKFPSGFEVRHGPFVVDDCAAVPIHTGDDFMKSSGGFTFSSKGLCFVKNPRGPSIPEQPRLNSEERVLSMFAPKARASETCIVCATIVAGAKACSKCKQSDGPSVLVRYCSVQCQKSDWPRHKKYCGKVDDPVAVDAKERADAGEKPTKIEPSPGDSGSYSGVRVSQSQSGSYIIGMGCMGSRNFELARTDTDVLAATRRFVNNPSNNASLTPVEELSMTFAHRLCEQANLLLYGEGRNPALGLVRDYAKLASALSLYEKCRPHPEALFQLGLCYRDALGVRKDTKKAFGLFTESCEQELAVLINHNESGFSITTHHLGSTCEGAHLSVFKSRINLGVMAFDGSSCAGGNPDFSRAAMHFLVVWAYLGERNAGGGSKESEVAELLETATQNYAAIKHEHPADFHRGRTLAHEYFRAKLIQCPLDTVALFQCAEALRGEYEDVCEVDLSTAAKYYQRSLAGGSLLATNLIACCKLQDSNKDAALASSLRISGPDHRGALALFKRVAEAGVPVGIHNLARMYQFGRGCAVDESKAMELFWKASDLGWTNSTVNLAGFYLNGWTGKFPGEDRPISFQPDQQKALDLLHAAAEKDGNPVALRTLEQLASKGLVRQPPRIGSKAQKNKKGKNKKKK